MKAAVIAIALFAALGRGQTAAGSDWPLWSRYASRFISADGRVEDPDRGSMTTSEGQAYAMFFALAADDRSCFERLRAWTESNLAQGDLRRNLPAWSWGRSGDGSWRVLDANSAADADLWMAYSLVQAGRLWRDPEYGAAGAALLSLIAKEEVAVLPDIGPVLLPGREGFHPEATRWVLNPSYSPLPLFLAAAGADPEGPWKRMADALPIWLRQASPSGFAMDWVEYSQPDGFRPASGPGGAPASGPGDGPGKASPAARGSYDAIRVYLWAGMTGPGSPGADALLAIYRPMALLLRTEAAPPESVGSGGGVLRPAGPPGFSAAVLPFLTRCGESAAAAAQLSFVNRQFDSATGLLGDPARYYNQNLALFALGWQEGRFRFADDGTLRTSWADKVGPIKWSR